MAADLNSQEKAAALPLTLEALRPDQNMVDLRLISAQGCPKIAANQFMDLCGVTYSDRVVK